MSSASTNTTVRIVPDAVHATARWLRRTGERLQQTDDDLRGEATATAGHWSGLASDSALARVRDTASHASRVAADGIQASAALTAFADDIAAVRTQMAAARTYAVEAGLRVVGQVIQLSSGASAAHKTAFDTAVGMVKAARKNETAAHTELQASLSLIQDVFDYVHDNRVSITTAAAHNAYERFGKKPVGNSAAVHKRYSDAARVVATDSTVPAGIRNLATRQFTAQEQRFLVKAGGSQALTHRVPLKFGGKVIARVPVLGTGLNVAFAANDIANGEDAGKTVTSTLLTTGAVAIAAFAGPPGLAGLALGVGVSIGVGWAVDQFWPEPPPDKGATSMVRTNA